MMNESKRLEELKRDFDTTYQRSLNKDAFLEKKIEGYASIFDDKKLDLSIKYPNYEPLQKYSISYSSTEIFLIREFYVHFIVEGNDISELEKENDVWNSWVRDIYEYALDDLSEPFGPMYYYNLASDLYEYLKWLRHYSETRSRNNVVPNKQSDTMNEKFPVHFYAFYHRINETYVDDRIKLPQGHKKEIIKTAERLYPVKGVNFYNSYMRYSRMKLINSVKLMPLKKRNKFRENTFKIARLFNNQAYIPWWETTFLDKSKNTFYK